MKYYMKYTQELPQEATLIITSLDDPIRRAILILLRKYDELSFSDMRKELGLTKLTLNYHLKNLYSAGLTDHYFRHEFGNQKYSYYSITSLGKRILSNLVKALVPPVPFQKVRKEETPEKYELVSGVTSTCFASYWSGNKKKVVKVVAPSCIVTKSSEPNYPTNRSTYTETE